MKYRRWRYPIGLAGVFVALMTTPVAHAEGLSCGLLSGEADGYQVYKLVLPQPSNNMSIGIGGPAAINGVVNEENYYYGVGIEILGATTGNLEAYRIAGLTGRRPTAVVQSGSQTQIKKDLVGPQVPLGWDWNYLPDGLSAGVHYVVAFGFGSGHFQGTLSMGVPPGTGSCTPVTPAAADKIKYDLGDFNTSGQDLRTSGQAYAIAAGAGGGLTLSFPTTKRYFAGYILGAVLHGDLTPPGTDDFRLEYNTPGPDGIIIGGGQLGASWLPGTASFKLSYRGLIPDLHIDGWALDLPSS